MTAAPIVVATGVLALALAGGGSAASSMTLRHSAANVARLQRIDDMQPILPLFPPNTVVPAPHGTPIPPRLPGLLPFLPSGTQLPYLNSGCSGTPFRDSLTAPLILVQTCFVAP
jgi:hypothetical protein